MADMTDNSVAAVEAPASRASNMPVVVDAVQAHLDAFNDIETPDTPAVEAAPVETPETSAAAETPEASETPVAETPKEAVASEASTLPAGYVRTAKARGWTDQEIGDFAKANPDLAIKTFERMHESRTKEINEWAELGRKVRQSPVASSPAPTSAPVHAPAPAGSLQPINVQEMVDKFGNQELIEALAGPINAAIASVQPLIQGATQAQEQARRSQQESLGKVVQDFFTDKSMAPFAETYGKGMATLTPAQIEVRSRVLETADALIAGASFQGRQLSVQEALTLAHDSVSSGTKENIIRDQIRTSVQKRAKGITLRPTATGRANPDAAPRDRAELVGRTEDRLSKAFG